MIIAAAILATFGYLAVRSYAGVPSTVVASSTQQSVEVVEPVTPPELPDGISPALYRTLASQDAAWVLPTEDAERQLPTSIVRVLEANNAVLRVVDGATK